MTDTKAGRFFEEMQSAFVRKPVVAITRFYVAEIKNLENVLDQLSDEGAAAVPQILRKSFSDEASAKVCNQVLENCIADFPENKSYVQDATFKKSIGKDTAFVAVIKFFRRIYPKSLKQHIPANLIASAAGLEISRLMMKLDEDCFRMKLEVLRHVSEIVKTEKPSIQAELRKKIKAWKSEVGNRVEAAVTGMFLKVLADASSIGTFEMPFYALLLRFNIRVLEAEKKKREAALRITSEYIDIYINQIQAGHVLSRVISAFSAEAAQEYDELKKHYTHIPEKARKLAGVVEKEASLTSSGNFQTIRARLDESITKHLIDPLNKLKSESFSADSTDDFIRAVLQDFDDLPLLVKVIVKKDDVIYPPAFKIASLSLNQEISSYVKAVYIRNIRLLPNRISEVLAFALEESDDVRQVIEVNLDTADSENKADAIKLAGEGLKRASLRISELENTLVEKLDAVLWVIQQETDKLSQYLKSLIADENLHFIQSKNRQLTLKKRAVDSKTKLISGVLKLQDKITAVLRLSMLTWRKYVSPVLIFLGFKPKEKESAVRKTNVADFLADTQKSIENLPLIYKRLFNGEPLTEPRFYKKRSMVKDVLLASWNSWNSNHFANYILIGEKGSGKTSAFNMLIPETIKGYEVCKGEIKQTIWSESEMLVKLSEIAGIKGIKNRQEFIGKLNSGKKKIVVLEGLHNLYLRSMLGLEAIESFMMILNETGKNVFWVVSCSRYAWDYLDKLLKTSGYFTHLCFSENLNEDQIADIILSRHRVSGYDIEYIPSKEVAGRRSYKKLLDDEEASNQYLQNNYFKELSDLSEGSIAIAILIWLRSVREIFPERIVIAPISEQPLDIGDDFTREDVFTLGSIVLHDDLTESELATVLNIPEHQARLTLMKLTARSILDVSNGRYRLNYLLYRMVVRLLKQRNILH